MVIDDVVRHRVAGRSQHHILSVCKESVLQKDGIRFERCGRCGRCGRSC